MVLILFIVALIAAEETSYSFTGYRCKECLEAGRNHCLLEPQ